MCDYVNVIVWGRDIKKVSTSPNSETLGPDPSLPVIVTLPCQPIPGNRGLLREVKVEEEDVRQPLLERFINAP